MRRLADRCPVLEGLIQQRVVEFVAHDHREERAGLARG